MEFIKTRAVKIILTAAVAIVGATFVTAAKSSNDSKRYYVTVSRDFYRANFAQLRAHDIDVAGQSIPKNLVQLIVDEKGRQFVRSLSATAIMAVTPAGRGSPDSKFKTPDQIVSQLKSLAQTHPDIAQAIEIGKTLQGREIYALKITSHIADAAADKPVVFFNGMHHAREVMSPEVPLDIASTLAEGYGKDAKITHWLDTSVVYVLPMLNMDGNNIVWTSDTMWRKNAHGQGVDINRNYPFAWNSCGGSSNFEGAQDYHGTGPASEPETNVMMNFVSSIHPVFSISFHSYSELVIYPYGCGNHTETQAVVEPIGAKIADLIVSDDGTSKYAAGTPPELLYPVDGGDIDWYYHEAKVIPFVIELNSMSQGFQPGYDEWRDSTVKRVRPAWQFLLERLDGSGISGNAKEIAGATSVDVISTNSAAPYSENHPLHADGSFFFVLNVGEYKVRINSADNKSILEQTIKVGDSHVRLKL